MSFFYRLPNSYMCAFSPVLTMSGRERLLEFLTFLCCYLIRLFQDVKKQSQMAGLPNEQGSWSEGVLLGPDPVMASHA